MINGVTTSFELVISTPVKLAITTNNEKITVNHSCVFKVLFSNNPLKKRVFTNRNANTMMMPSLSASNISRLNIFLPPNTILFQLYYRINTFESIVNTAQLQNLPA